ncbi:reverse transcriptase domain-containing protein [Tanacetum coccineum]
MVIEGEVLNDFPGFVCILIAEFAAGGAVNLALKMEGDMIIKNLDLEPTIDAMMRDFLESSFARYLIEINAEDVLQDSLTIGIPCEDDGFSIEYEWKPPRCDLCKKKKKKGKSKSNVNMVNSPNQDNITSSNSFATLNKDIEDEEEVENVFDETANLFNSKTSGRSSFTAVVKLLDKITVRDTEGVNEIVRKQTPANLSPQEKLRYDSDIKAVNILLLGFPVDIYTLINHYQTTKEIWDHVKELMEGIEMTKQERESMLYDEFDKFTSEPGESIHSYYLRYAKLINDMKMIPMSTSNMQINTKFVNHLQPKWSRFVTAAKQARDLHKPLALLENTYNPPPSYNRNQTQYQAPPFEVYQPYQHYQSSTPITQQLIQSPSLQSYALIVVQQPPTFQSDTGFAIPTFLPTDDPIASLNKAMIFLSLVYRLKCRQSQGYTGNAGNNQASGARVRNAWANQIRVVRCYNCNGEGHIAKQCTAKKRVKDSEWFKDKMLLAQVIKIDYTF